MLKGRAYHCNDVTVKWGHVHFVQQTVQSPVKTFCLGFPSGPVVKSLPANAGDMGLIPGWGRFQMPWEQLGSCALTTELALQSA